MNPIVDIKYERGVLQNNRGLFTRAKKANNSRYNFDRFDSFDQIQEEVEGKIRDTIESTFRDDHTGKLDSLEKVEVTMDNGGKMYGLSGYCEHPKISDGNFGKIGLHSDNMFRDPYLRGKIFMDDEDVASLADRKNTNTIEHELVHLKDISMCIRKPEYRRILGKEHPDLPAVLFQTLLRTEGLAMFYPETLSKFNYPGFLPDTSVESIENAYREKVNSLNLLSQFTTESLEKGEVMLGHVNYSAYRIGEEMFRTIQLANGQEILGESFGNVFYNKEVANYLKDILVSEALHMKGMEDFFQVYLNAASAIGVTPAITDISSQTVIDVDNIYLNE